MLKAEHERFGVAGNRAALRHMSVGCASALLLLTKYPYVKGQWSTGPRRRAGPMQATAR